MSCCEGDHVDASGNDHARGQHGGGGGGGMGLEGGDEVTLAGNAIQWGQCGTTKTTWWRAER